MRLEETTFATGFSNKSRFSEDLFIVSCTISTLEVDIKPSCTASIQADSEPKNVLAVPFTKSSYEVRFPDQFSKDSCHWRVLNRGAITG